MKIKATEIRPLPAPLSPSAKTVHLKIPLAQVTSSQLVDLKDVVIAHSGLCHLLLHMVDADQKETLIALPDRYAVDPSEPFQSRVKTLFQSSLFSLE